jgi:hypothetical protein
MCHLIFFIPFFALPVFWLLPFNTALTIYLLACGLYIPNEFFVARRVVKV